MNKCKFQKRPPKKPNGKYVIQTDVRDMPIMVINNLCQIYDLELEIHKFGNFSIPYIKIMEIEVKNERI